MKNSIIIRSYKIEKKGLSSKGKFSFVFLTDLHISKEIKYLEKIEQMIDQLYPDFIVIGGDVIVGKPGESTQNALDFMKRISIKYKVIYANGNHEQRITEFTDIYGQMGKNYDQAISQLKCVRLINDKTEITVKNIPIVVYGHQPDIKFYRRGKKTEGMKADLVDKFEYPDKNKYTILLSHTPRYEKEYLSWGADLTLSGHYHGGVMLLNKKRGLITPDYRLFPSQCCGVRGENSKMIISAGAGEHTIPIRIHNPREITYISVECS